MSSLLVKILSFLTLAASVLAAGNYGQCGGVNWQDTGCSDGWVCLCQTQWYSQCLPPGSALPSGWGGNGCPNSPVVVQQPPSNPNPNPPSGGGGGGGGNSGSCSTFNGDKSGYATTTHYYDGQKGACGCGSGNSLFQWQVGSGKIWTAAGSPSLFSPSNPSSTWCGGGCGSCWELTNTGTIPGDRQGTCDGGGETIVVQLTNLCPAQGNEVWCQTDPVNDFGFAAHFDIMSAGYPAQGWNNPVVKYRQVDCPSDLKSRWQTCECSGRSRVKRGIFEKEEISLA